MDPKLLARIEANPRYQALRRQRSRLGWALTALMLLVYYGYIALIAFDKPFLAQPIGTGVTSLGVPIGMGVIVFTVVITALYVRHANRTYDRMTAELLREVQR